MDNKKLTDLASYKATMQIVKRMLSEKLITSEEYAEIDTIMAEKYGLYLSVIYR